MKDLPRMRRTLSSSISSKSIGNKNLSLFPIHLLQYQRNDLQSHFCLLKLDITNFSNNPDREIRLMLTPRLISALSTMTLSIMTSNVTYLSHFPFRQCSLNNCTATNFLLNGALISTSSFFIKNSFMNFE